MILSLNTSPTVEKIEKNNHCYTDDDVELMAEAITDLAKCKIELSNKNILIEQSLNKHDQGNSLWQEPGFVFGGMAVSFSAGVLLGLWFTASDK